MLDENLNNYKNQSLGRLLFPAGFFWGTGISAHQFEGNNIHNDWWAFEHSPQRIKELEAKGLNPQNFISGRACDFYNRFESDLDLAQSLNNNAFRFSIEWSRIEPEEGKFDRNEIDYYRRLLWACQERGLEPFVTLWHCTLPLWFAKLGGFKNTDISFYFNRFVKRIVEELGSEVKFWITLNEPEVYSTSAYFRDIYPPREKSFFSMVRVFRRLIKVHQETYRIIHQVFPRAQVGLAKNNPYFEAAGGKLINRCLKKGADYFGNDYFLNRVKNQLDFIGLNYYFHNRIDFRWRRPVASFYQNKNELVSDLGWEIYPEGIYHVLKDLARYGKPIYITENGLADKDDSRRAKFIQDHLYWVWKAINDEGVDPVRNHARACAPEGPLGRAISNGVDVRGYLHWSLLDFFEWEAGFEPRFGLFEMDYQTLERRKRPSADYYASICKNNALPDS